ALTGVLIANEWLDNVPIDVAERHESETRLMLVQPDTGAQQTGRLLTEEETAWLARWWPPTEAGELVELGHTRDAAWADAVGTVRAGLALAIDYGHLRDHRPVGGSMTGYASGRQVAATPNGSCDVTAHVAVDSVARAGELSTNASGPAMIGRQRDCLRALGLDAARPPRELASRDPVEYLRVLDECGQAAELLDSAGLGGFWWLAQPVAMLPTDRQRVAQILGMPGLTP
ncbi:MAG: SAM-dependent methyltransferase, partial [Pseudonocardiaceae bacterium]